MNKGVLDIHAEEAYVRSSELMAGSVINRGLIQLFSDLDYLVVGSGTPTSSGFTQFSNSVFGEIIDASGFGLIVVNGNATLDGTLSVLLDKNFNPSIGSEFRFLTFTPGQLNGIFASVENLYFNHGTEEWTVVYDNAEGYVALEAVPSPEPSTLLLIGTGLVGVVAYGRRGFSR